MRLSSISLVLVIISWSNGQFRNNQRFRQLPFRAAQNFRNRLKNRLDLYRERNTQMVCYDIVGCFTLPHSNSPLQRVPEDPKTLGTKFYLITRKTNTSIPEILFYNDDGKSLQESSFNSSNILKVLIHGYTSKWNEKNALLVTDAYLQLYDCNVILMDWKIGARGPQYVVAAANTEVVGRELGILLTKMVENGLKTKNIHLIGFSLGAHVAGSASEILKGKGHLIGRITGLDAAGPLFRNSYFKEKHKKLDRSDAILVDAMHTDSSPFVTDGFGLWEPIGHVDFFPNGGQEQPGCNDVKNSILVTQFENRGALNRDFACSHIRAFRLFIETVLNKLKYRDKKSDYCQFTAFSCPGGLSTFESGYCFPQIEKSNGRLVTDSIYAQDEIGQFGEDVRGQGVMYFSTRDSSSYCGRQLQLSVHVSQNYEPTKGLLKVNLHYSNKSIDFEMYTDIQDFVTTGAQMYGLGVADFHTFIPEVIKKIKVHIFFFNPELYENGNETTSSIIYINKVMVRDMHGNSWQHCKNNMPISDTIVKKMILSNEDCNY
ncbi:hypothetical protein GWI33_001695 [Rhynchophorus ferrugineus]|uniref:Lipase domain-containing protein n=1 Tax=Rhynchophorus ferrugineus TaxID=354439 RepID=A0A834IZS5_RHYFE|nr:hypothetical protein GWI33_001695 [Rhynchophorus ferrugineus]